MHTYPRILDFFVLAAQIRVIAHNVLPVRPRTLHRLWHGKSLPRRQSFAIRPTLHAYMCMYARLFVSICMCIQKRAHREADKRMGARTSDRTQKGTVRQTRERERDQRARDRDPASNTTSPHGNASASTRAYTCTHAHACVLTCMCIRVCIHMFQHIHSSTCRQARQPPGPPQGTPCTSLWAGAAAGPLPAQASRAAKGVAHGPLAWGGQAPGQLQVAASRVTQLGVACPTK